MVENWHSNSGDSDNPDNSCSGRRLRCNMCRVLRNSADMGRLYSYCRFNPVSGTGQFQLDIYDSELFIGLDHSHELYTDLGFWYVVLADTGPQCKFHFLGLNLVYR